MEIKKSSRNWCLCPMWTKRVSDFLNYQPGTLMIYFISFFLSLFCRADILPRLPLLYTGYAYAGGILQDAIVKIRTDEENEGNTLSD